MARAAPKALISADMLRHFAAITVVATLCLAMFANGENKAAMAAEQPKPEQEAQESGGGVMSAMFGGAEEAALKQSREGHGKRDVGGFMLGKGTHLANNEVDSGDDGGGSGESQGNIDNFYAAPTGETTRYMGPAAAAGPAAIPPGTNAPTARDSRGVPLPPSLGSAGTAPGAGLQKQPPRRPTAADFANMLEASRQRGGLGRPDAEAE